jgi:hypothetical protein
MENFLQETINAILNSGHTKKDVMFIGSEDGKLRLNFNDFSRLANFNYDSGYGSPEIPQDLIIYFYDKTYAIREEYDGSEWWKYNEPLNFDVKDKHKKYTKLHNINYCYDLKELQED